MNRDDLAVKLDWEIRRSERARYGAAATVDHARCAKQCTRSIVEEARGLRARLRATRQQRRSRTAQAGPEPTY